MATFGTNYGMAELRCAQAVQDAVTYYLVDGTMPNYGTLYGDKEKRLAIAIVENTSIGGGGGSVPDGNKGDVTVSSGGNQWTVNNLPQSRITGLVTDLSNKQDVLVSGVNIKTINGLSLPGSGDLSITTTPAGSNQQIQFNDNGVLGASSSLIWNGTSLGVGVAVPTARLDLANSTNIVGLRLKPFASQTNNLIEWYSSSNNLEGFVDRYGSLVIKAKDSATISSFAVQKNDATTNFLDVSQNNGVGRVLMSDGGSNALLVGGGGGIAINNNNAGPVYIHAGTASGAAGSSLNILSRNTFVYSFSGSNVPLTIRVGTNITQTANLVETRGSTNAILSILSKADGSYSPATLTDLLATNNSLYYSSTQSRLSYKDNVGNIVVPVNKLGDTNVGPLVLKSGGVSTGTSPLKLTSQPSPLINPEQGAFELVGNSLQFTQLVRRRGVAMGQNVIIADTIITNSTAESSPLISSDHGANYLEVGKVEELVLRGTIQQSNTGGGQLQIRVKYAGVTIQTITTISGNIAAGTPYVLEVATTCRQTGANGLMQINSKLRIDGQNNSPDSSNLITIDTTTAQKTEITAQWTVANANDSFTVNQGRVLCIDPSK